MKRSALLLALLLAAAACRGCLILPVPRLDPALAAEDPAAFLGDDWDRRAASIVDAPRATDLSSLVSRPGTERAVVDMLRATTARAGNREILDATMPARAPAVLLIRRARVAAVARILTSDPVRDLRKRAVLLMEQTLPDHDRPSVEAIAEVLAREEDDEARTRLLRLLATRRAPARTILDAAMHGFLDPVAVSVGIHGLFVEENRELLEKAYAEGDAIGRAGIGETFYRHRSPMPWAEALILKGLSDPDSDVRARFARGTLVLRPFSAAVRARLQAMAAEVPDASWALSIEKGGS